ncbi:two-component regulator propeller domain-containing protein [Bacteroidota bacterium]
MINRKYFTAFLPLFIIIFLLLHAQTRSQEDAEWHKYQINWASALAEERNIIWFGSHYEGLFKIDKSVGGTPKPVTIPAHNLNSRIIHNISIDKNGIKWIATQNGIFRWDGGSDWKNCNMSNPNVPILWASFITIDNNGNKWFAAKSDLGRLFKFSGETEFSDTSKWVIYNDASYPGLSTANIRYGIFDQNNNLYLATQNGILRKDTYDNFSIFHSGIGFWDIYLDKNNNHIWATTPTSLYQFENDEELTILDSTWQVDSLGVITNEMKSCFVIDSSGNKWWGMETGLFKYENDEWIYIDSTKSDEFYKGYGVKSLLVDKDGILWIGTNEGAIVKKMPNDDWLKVQPSYPLLPDDNIMKIVADNKDHLWFATQNGLAKFDGQNWTSWLRQNSDLPNRWINDIAIDENDTKWLATQNGLVKFEDDSMHVYDNSNQNFPDYWFGCLLVDNDTLWVGTGFKGLLKFVDGEVIESFDQSNGVAAQWIRSIAKDSNNQIWIGAGVGLNIINEESIRTEYISNYGIIDNPFVSISVDKNNKKWAGTYGRIAIFDSIGNYEKSYRCPDIGLPIGWVNAIEFDENGDVWIATTSYDPPNVGGLAKLNIKTGDWTVFQICNSGIAWDPTKSIHFDDEGTVWIGTYGGLSQYSPKIFTDTIETEMCAGEALQVSYYVKDGYSFRADNWFRLQLSHPDGIFYDDSVYYYLDSIKSKTDGVFNITLPKDIEFSDKYRIRVSASSSFARGVDNGADITINPLPKPEITAGDIIVLPGSNKYYKSNLSSDYLWKVEGGAFTLNTDSTDREVIIKWGSPGKGKITLIQTNWFGCIDSVEVEVEVKSIKPNISGENSICELDTSIYFVNNGIVGADLLWSLKGNGTIISDKESDTIEVKWGQKGNDTLFLIQTINGYSEGNLFIVNIKPRPEKPVIIEKSGVLYSNSMIGNQWYHNDTLIPGATNDYITPSVPSGYYQVQVTGENGCVSEMSDSLEYSEYPKVWFEIADTDTLRAKPGEEIQAPIYMKSNEDISQSGLDNIDARLRYNYTLLKPLDNVQSEINDGKRIIQLSMKYEQKELLETLNFKAELGNSISTKLILDNISFTGAALSPTSETYSVLFELEGVCMEDGYPRLISNTGKAQLLLVSPNPSTESCELEYELIEKGSTKIYICNTYGEVVRTVLYNEIAQPGKEKLSINTSDLSTGMYFVILQTPTIRKAVKMEVVK